MPEISFPPISQFIDNFDTFMKNKKKSKPQMFFALFRTKGWQGGGGEGGLVEAGRGASRRRARGVTGTEYLKYVKR